MVDLSGSQTILTPTIAAIALQTQGLDAFGFVIPNLSPVWSSARPDADAYDAAQLTLRLADLKAPFRGIREFGAQPAAYSGPDGKPMIEKIAVFRLHPDAARRLTALVENRLNANPVTHPLPVALVIRNVPSPTPPKVPETFMAGEAVDIAGPVTISFHDERGLIVDPVAVACLFRDLLVFRPALYVHEGAAQTVDVDGGLDGIAALASGTLIHVIDPHGWGYVPTRDKARLQVLDASGSAASAVPDGGLVTLTDGQGLGRTATDDPADDPVKPLRWGFATNGTLARTLLVPPTLPSGITLARQFFRVMAVDLDWHLVGNRQASETASVPGDDDAVPNFLLPAVRDPVPSFAYLADAQDVVAAAGAMIAGFGGQAASAAIAASPVLDEALRGPAQAGKAGHWPDFPAFASPQPIGPTTDPRKGATAARRSAADGPAADHDVIVTVAAGTVPDGAHLRLFPRLFQQIAAIGDTPSFIRPDGGSAIAQAGTAIKIALVNPFGLRAADPFPDTAMLAVDMVVTDRTGKRRLLSQVTIAVDPGPESLAIDPAVFSGDLLLGANALKAALDAGASRAIAQTALFGLPRTTPLPPISDTAAFVRAMASESQPRQGPRLPTMMRFDSVLATGTAAAADTPMAWNAVVSGVRFTAEARSFRPDLANPGNPAGPDVLATGIRCGGLLARDLAVHAIKRAQPIVPMGGGTKGWIVETKDTNWDQPPDDTTGTVAAAMLETVAAICDTPELSLAPDPAIDNDLQQLVDEVRQRIGSGNLPALVNNTVERVRRIQREIVTAKHGQRDALWSLVRAFKQAREFIYIESPGFAHTARQPASGQMVNLVKLLGDALTANKRLKLVVCTPRLPDFAADKQGWVRTALKHRKEAIEELAAKARPEPEEFHDVASRQRSRLAAFHPIGFPGRSSPLRTTTIVVDDVWCLVGTSHFRRRGMTFDGAVDVASIDRQISNGYSNGIAKFRQSLMAQRLGVAAPTTAAETSALWIRLAHQESAFSVIAELLDQGGEGRLTPMWAGPSDDSVLPQTDDVADPDGTNGATFQTFIAGALAGE